MGGGIDYISTTILEPIRYLTNIVCEYNLVCDIFSSKLVQTQERHSSVYATLRSQVVFVVFYCLTEFF